MVDLLQSAARYLAALEDLVRLGAFRMSVWPLSPAFVFVRVLDAAASRFLRLFSVCQDFRPDAHLLLLERV